MAKSDDSISVFVQVSEAAEPFSPGALSIDFSAQRSHGNF